ncbi:hypothetical protein E3_1270 [Rhodococcus phage E3]|uniref:hypothetical protein n=1 Tax=Rhodococcus phage E3 TaxID=1007869 RepID=UPI0002C6B4F3|nr:hypothetical protein M176_gp133 [Rhodococcus phage E3]AEQ21041.1 hypothetical protein E3_1270 [Rhodococcus phage E3]
MKHLFDKATWTDGRYATATDLDTPENRAKYADLGLEVERWWSVYSLPNGKRCSVDNTGAGHLQGTAA